MLTKEQALIQLEELLATGTATPDKLKTLVSQVSLGTATGRTQGSVTVLYSGTINGVSSTDYIADLIQKNADIRVIDNTHVGQFLADPKFGDAWRSVGGTSAQLFNGATGPWAQASARFVADTTGDIRLLGFSPASDSVFVQTELKKALENGSRITSIEGIPVTRLRSMSFANALDAVTVASGEHAGYSGFKITSIDDLDASGNLQFDRRGNVRRTLVSLNAGDFLNPAVLNLGEYIKSTPKAVQYKKDGVRSFKKDGVRSFIITSPVKIISWPALSVSNSLMPCITSLRGATGGRIFTWMMRIGRLGWLCWGRCASALTGRCMLIA